MAEGTRLVEVAPGEWYAALGHLQTDDRLFDDARDRSPLGPFSSDSEALIAVEARYGKLNIVRREPYVDPDVESLLCLTGLED